MVTVMYTYIAEVHQCCPTLVRGEKEAEVAIAEGKYPVIDILTDVFAIPSATGTSVCQVLKNTMMYFM